MARPTKGSCPGEYFLSGKFKRHPRVKQRGRLMPIPFGYPQTHLMSQFFTERRLVVLVPGLPWFTIPHLSEWHLVGQRQVPLQLLFQFFYFFGCPTSSSYLYTSNVGRYLRSLALRSFAFEIETIKRTFLPAHQYRPLTAALCCHKWDLQGTKA